MFARRQHQTYFGMLLRASTVLLREIMSLAECGSNIELNLLARMSDSTKIMLEKENPKPELGGANRRTELALTAK